MSYLSLWEIDIKILYEAYSKPCQISKIERFAKIVNS